MKRILLLLIAASCVTSTPAADLSEAKAGSTFTRQGDYLIGATDQISVSVFGEDSLKGTYTVAPTGVLNFPIIGFIQAAGMTSQQLNDKLQTALKSYVKYPRVTTIVTSRDSYKAFFTGEVTRPGSYSFQTRTTLVQGLAIAGGLTRFASGRIVLIRQATNGSSARYAALLSDIIAGRNQLDQFVLERGDVIIAE